MTGRTHDLAAFTALNYIIATTQLQEMSLATALVAFSVNMIGGLAPDLDQPTANLYYRVRGGSLISRVISPLLGGHRLLSHSILGIVLFGFVSHLLLNFTKDVLIVDRDIVWWSFMIGFVSHLVMDSFTHEGVPWLFPIPFKFGVPPLKFLRMKTGGFLEKSFVFPGLLLINVCLFYQHYDKFLQLIRHYLK